jgi:recombinational DNA repair ATPase RecF
VAELDARFRVLTTTYFPKGELQLAWQGAHTEEEIRGLLEAHRPGDVARGFTYLSPKRGDLAFRRNGDAWAGSRGENKLAGTLLQLSAQIVQSAETGFPSIVLLDDPFSELASDVAEPVLEAWLEAAEQVFVASLRHPGTHLPEAKVFHVEHGRLRDS